MFRLVFRLLCKSGWHDWVYFSHDMKRTCKCCLLRQERYFDHAAARSKWDKAGAKPREFYRPR